MTGIPIGLSYRTVHFLHAVDDSLKDHANWIGHEIGRFRIHIGKGPAEEIPLKFGENIGPYQGLSRIDDALLLDRAAALQPDFNGGELWVISWRNPYPEAVIDSIDFISENAFFEPFMVAVTVE